MLPPLLFCGDIVELDGNQQLSKLPTYKISLVRPLSSTLMPKLLNKMKVASNERQMLEMLLLEVEKIDPDLLIGHNLLGRPMSLLCERLRALKVAGWSVLGKLRRSEYAIF